MHIRRRLIGLSIAAAMGLLPVIATSPAAAVLSECDLTTEVCATLTVAMGNVGSGNFATYADQFHLTAVGINCSQFIAVVQGTCAYRYTLYKIGATPTTRTLYWSSVADSKSLTCVEGCGSHLASLSGSITLSANQSAVIHAYFEPKNPKALGVGKNGSGSGTVTALYPGGINCGATCAWTYDSSYTVELVATPDADSTFDGWSGACSGTAHCFAAMSDNRSVTATFTKIATPPPTAPPTPKPTATPLATPVQTAPPLQTPTPTGAPTKTPTPTPAPSKTGSTPIPGSTSAPATTQPPLATPPPGSTGAPGPTEDAATAAPETAGTAETSGGTTPTLVPIATPPGLDVQPTGSSSAPLILLLVALLVVFAGGALFFMRRPR